MSLIVDLNVWLVDNYIKNVAIVDNYFIMYFQDFQVMLTFDIKNFRCKLTKLKNYSELNKSLHS